MAEKLLIKNLKKGHEDAYRQVIEDYGNKLLRTCYLILKDREEAEDIVQETLIKVFQKLRTFKENSGLYTWIYTIALNLCRDRLRKKREILSLEDEWVGSEDVESHVETNVDRELLRKELFTINPLYREVLVLFYFDDFSIKEISNLLNEKEGTIKSRLSRGRNILKEKLLKGGQLNGE
ncbi:RNA polymerase sigma factor [Sedimentibacter sp. MB31-C6]|uniref:RNA polymerase sigma factor n=1 Tax=Sedimentibacter sp. MB31-C6 TaxID=3109366 RepID=UPI002DDCB9BD|nr:sigma-70 family RNA polymerase sigma factor [Sedimentibacter sp. MB36-C1]WSI03221.1 sigma-70 family RNA polymerase sigma factor [Sedimentibacter sp. MB36-C1]